MSGKTKIGEVFSDYQTSSNIKYATITALNVIKKEKKLQVIIYFDEYVEIKEIWYFEKFLKERFQFEQIDIKINYHDRVEKKSIKEEWRNIIAYMAHKYPLTKPMLLLKSDIEVNGKDILIKMHIKGADFLRAKKTDQELAKVLFNLFGEEYKIEIREELSREEIDKIKETHKDDAEFQRKYEQLMKTPVFVDSPLAISATEIFKKNTDLFEEEVQEKLKHGDHPLEFPGLQFTPTADESKALNETYYPSIMISASGMCDIGRIKHHLKHNLWNPASTILFVGYQAPGTLGRTIVDGADKVKIFGEEISVNARVEYIEGYSGHADQEWLLNFVYSFINKPKHIFLVHGEEDSQEVLKGLIEANVKIPVTIPSFGEKYEVAEIPQLQECVEYSKKIEEQFLRLQILEKLDKIKDEINNMTQTVKEEKLMKENPNTEIEKLNDKVKKLEEQIKGLIE